ncbi:ABC transporter substrate-binding protein [Paenibacillus sedimenti]|uniref:Carbohydrate ABC transporter substrate-binding protein n=1 Tax=Paenibacillus sedimenti TaxID=2770274 RepID=A0A926KIW3_9BACL|nr:ABC transporter substrate-binding protein [Paenibacillus sedimenti]MBD0378542.1 carbohydrate ABC transporter substrate-binding protein [Paenibacillus sedimenti]
MRMKRLSCLLISILFFVLGLSGCSDAAIDRPSSIPGDEDVTITLWAYDKGVEDKINEEFNKVYPNIHVNVVLVPWSEYDNRFLLNLSTGTDVPDIVKVESYWWGKWLAMEGAFENLTNYGVDPKNVMPGVADVTRNAQGEFVILPAATGIASIWYNKAVARRYLGTDDPTALADRLKTWDDLLEIGETVKTNSGGKAFLFPDSMSIEELLVTSNKNYLQGYTLRLKENILPRFRFIEALLDRGYIARLQEFKLERSYTEDTVLFYPYADWHATNIQNADKDGIGRWGILAPPGGIFYRGGNGYAMPKKSKPENKKAAALRMNFALTRQGSEAVIRTHQFSAYNDAYSDEILNAIDPYFDDRLSKKFFDWTAGKPLKQQFGPYDNIIEKELRMQAYYMMVENIGASKAIGNAISEIKARIGTRIKYGDDG